jgi:hypothetical protein
MSGPEPWKTVGGESFTFWDRWLLVLAVNTPDGWAGVRTAITSRSKTRFGFRPAHEDIEAKLAQIENLVDRLKSVGLTPEKVLGADARDRRLVAKARIKVLDQEVSEADKTPAMKDTPRRRLEERALRGHWPKFPVSPAKYEPLLAPDSDSFDLTRTFSLARRLDKLGTKEAKRVKGRPAELLALHRAMLTVILVAIQGADDSCGVLSDLFTEVIEEYAAVNWKSAGIAPEVFLRDAIEFAVWEDYGLTDELEAFFRKAEPGPAGVVEEILCEVEAELHEHGDTFSYQLEKLDVVRVNYLVAARGFDEFVAVATKMGSHQWGPIVAMAEAAWKARKRDLAVAVFTAANRPGRHQEYLQRECMRITGQKQAAAPRLRVVK